MRSRIQIRIRIKEKIYDLWRLKVEPFMAVEITIEARRFKMEL
jgi:hypothetical protein